MDTDLIARIFPSITSGKRPARSCCGLYGGVCRTKVSHKADQAGKGCRFHGTDGKTPPVGYYGPTVTRTVSA